MKVTFFNILSGRCAGPSQGNSHRQSTGHIQCGIQFLQTVPKGETTIEGEHIQYAIFSTDTKGTFEDKTAVSTVSSLIVTIK